MVVVATAVGPTIDHVLLVSVVVVDIPFRLVGGEKKVKIFVLSWNGGESL